MCANAQCLRAFIHEHFYAILPCPYMSAASCRRPEDAIHLLFAVRGKCITDTPKRSVCKCLTCKLGSAHTLHFLPPTVAHCAPCTLPCSLPWLAQPPAMTTDIWHMCRGDEQTSLCQPASSKLLCVWRSRRLLDDDPHAETTTLHCGHDMSTPSTWR